MKFRSLLPVLLILAACDQDIDVHSTPGGSGDEVKRLNALRDQAGLDPVSQQDYLVDAASAHAGYQAIASELTHYETDTTNALYTGYKPADRIGAAYGGPLPSDYYALEDVATNGGTAAVNTWWNTLYHRLPMMRHYTKYAGYGDRITASTKHPAAGVPDTGFYYGTLECLGVDGTPRSLSYWPDDQASGIERRFPTDFESPDPLDGNSGAGDTNSAPSRGDVGGPIHIIYPTSSHFTSLAVDFRVKDASSPLDTFVFVSTHSSSLGSNIYPDTFLVQGEIFIIPDQVLSSNTTYRVQVQANDGWGALPDLEWTFTTQ